MVLGLLLCSIAVVSARAEMTLQIDIDQSTIMAGMAVTGHMTLANDGAAAVRVNNRIWHFEGGLEHTIRKPDGQIVEISKETIGASVHMGGRPNYFIDPGKAIEVPIFVNMVNHELVFDLIGEYELTFTVIYNVDEPAIGKTVNIVVDRRGSDYDQYKYAINGCSYTWKSAFSAGCQYDWIVELPWSENSEYRSLIDEIFAYQYQSRRIRSLMRCASSGDFSTIVEIDMLEIAIAEGLHIAKSVDRNVVLWEQIAALYQENFGSSSRFSVDVGFSGEWRLR